MVSAQYSAIIILHYYVILYYYIFYIILLILCDGVEVRRRWAEYFEQVLNVADIKESIINVVGNWWMPVLGDLNERAILLEEVGEAVNEMKLGRPG